MATYVYGKKPPAAQLAQIVYNSNAIILNDVLSIFFNLPIGDPISKIIGDKGIGNIAGAAASIAANVVVGSTINAAMTALGFTYSIPNNITLLEYEYSSQPYINRAMLTYAAIKQDIEFTLRINAVIARFIPFLLHQGKMECFKAAIEYYADRGGTFTIITPGGTLTPCVFVRLDMIGGLGGAPGTQYDITFKKVNLGSKSAVGQLSAILSAITSGGT